MFTQKNLFSKITLLIAIAGFVLTVVPSSYADTDALKAPATTEKGSGEVTSLINDLFGKPSNAVQANTLAHTEVLAPIAKAFQEAGGRVFVRTHIYGDGGGPVDAVAFIKVPMASGIKEAIRKSLGSETEEVFAGFEVIDIKAQNPFINFSVSNLYTPDNRPINISRLRQALANEENVVLILVPGEVDKKGKEGPAGDIDSKKLIDKLEKIFDQALREHGIDPKVINKTKAPKSLPAIAQITPSDIASELKLAVIAPTPGSEIYRLMQLAQEAGINLKELLEKSLPAIKADDVQKEAQMAQEPLLGAPRELVRAVAKEVETKPQDEKPSPLAELRLAGIKINTGLQTIFLDNPNVQNLSGMDADLRGIEESARKHKKVVRIVVPAGSPTEVVLKRMLKTVKEDNHALTVISHPMFRNGRQSTAFIIRPATKVVLVGYGNEAVKLAPLYERAGYGVPAVAVHSLTRSERVVHAFEMGYFVHLTEEDPEKLSAIEVELKELLFQAFTSKARNTLLSELPESERLRKANDSKILQQAKELGRKEAEERFAKQYKGLLSKAILAGEYDVIDDATPEGTGAVNKKLYETAIKAHPEKKIVVLYQGGEKESVGEVSFSTVTTDFTGVSDLSHVRHVSCNTTSLSTIVVSILEGMGVPVDLDNNALRRGPDPGDIKDGAPGIVIQTKYHHGPDLISVTPPALQPLLTGINTDASAVGTNLRFHIHMLYLRRQDGKRFSKKQVQQIEAVQSRVALVDFPGDVFNSTRLTELAHNLMPQAVDWAPDGANHLLVPVLTVQETDDPAQLRLIYAVPQESIVAPGNINAADALLGMASKDASMAMVNDVSGISQIVPAVETRLPVKGLDEFALAQVTREEPILRMGGGSQDVLIDTQRAQALNVDAAELSAFDSNDNAIFNIEGGQPLVNFINRADTYLQTTPKARAVIVAPGFFRTGGAKSVLQEVARLRGVKLAFYGEKVQNLINLFGQNDVITGKTLGEVLAELAKQGIPVEDTVLFKSASDTIDAELKVRAVQGKISAIVAAKALKELLGDGVLDAFAEFYQELARQNVISAQVYNETKETMLAKMQEAGVFDFQVKPDRTQETQAKAEKCGQFLNNIGV